MMHGHTYTIFRCILHRHTGYSNAVLIFIYKEENVQNTTIVIDLTSEILIYVLEIQRKDKQLVKYIAQN